MKAEKSKNSEFQGCKHSNQIETISLKSATVLDEVMDAHSAGVKFFCCSPGLDIAAMTKDDLIPECTGVVGAAHFIEEIMTGESKVLTY